MTAIFGIAVTNLFLGFAFAVLTGHGPKSWSEVDAAVRVCRFWPRLVLPRLPRLRWRAADLLPTGERSRLTSDVSVGAVDRDRSSASGRTQSGAVAGDPPAVQRVAQRMVLTHLAAEPPEASGDPVGVLTEQLAAWRASESRGEMPCLSGIEVVADDTQGGGHVGSLLDESVRARIIRQLRKDRRLLRGAEHQFIWFSPDAHPDDALRPVERIRQMFDSTRFRYGDTVVSASVRSAIVAATTADTPQELMARLDRALACARETGVNATYVDRGDGPRPVEPTRHEIAPSECILA
jgi:hypothetical protein